MGLSSSFLSWLVHCLYRGKTRFCVLVLRPYNLLKAFINFKRFLVPSLGLLYKIIASISVIIDFSVYNSFLYLHSLYFYSLGVPMFWCICLELCYPLDSTFHQYELTLGILTNFDLNSILSHINIVRPACFLVLFEMTFPSFILSLCMSSLVFFLQA